MAQIRITIDLNDNETLADAMSAFSVNGARGLVRFAEENDLIDETEEPTARQTQDAEPGEQQRRRRRTKAEMEAAKTSEQTSQPSSAATESPTPAANSESNDVFGNQIKEVVAEMRADAAGAQPTLNDVRAAMSYAIEHGRSAKEMQEKILPLFKDSAGQPCKAASTLQAADYAAAIAAMREGL